MSLILDALKRAERERNADAVPAPGEVSVPLAGRAPPRGRRGLIVGGVAIVVLVAAVLGWKLLRGGKPAAPPQTVAQPQPTTTPIKARPAPSAYVPPVIPGTEAVASLDDLTDEPLLETEPPPPEATTAPVPAPTPAPALEQAQTPKPAEPATATPAEPSATPSPAPEIPPALTVQAPLRKFREMPPDYRADFPALKIEIHVYEKLQSQRFVMVNGRKYREGERLSEGPQLVEIAPEGLVLEFRGEKVLYTLGR